MKTLLSELNLWHLKSGIFQGESDFEKIQVGKINEEINELLTEVEHYKRNGEIRKNAIIDALGDIFISYFNYLILENGVKPLSSGQIYILSKMINSKIKDSLSVRRASYICISNDILPLKRLIAYTDAMRKGLDTESFIRNYVHLYAFCNHFFNLRIHLLTILDLTFDNIKGRIYKNEGDKQIKVKDK